MVTTVAFLLLVQAAALRMLGLDEPAVQAALLDNQGFTHTSVRTAQHYMIADGEGAQADAGASGDE